MVKIVREDATNKPASNNPYSRTIKLGSSSGKLSDVKQVLIEREEKRKKVEESIRKSDEAVKKSQEAIWDPRNIAGDIWNAFGGAYNRVGEGTAEVINDLSGANAERQKRNLAQDQEDIKIIRSYAEKIKKASPEKKAQLKESLGRIMNVIDTQTQSEQAINQQIIDRTDPVKAIGALGEVGLDVVTAGTLKGAKSVYGAGSTLSKIARGAGSGAGIGAGYGAAQTAQGMGSEATVGDYAASTGLGAVVGAAGGALFPAVEKLSNRVGNINPFSTLKAQLPDTKNVVETTKKLGSAKPTVVDQEQISKSLAVKDKGKMSRFDRASDWIRREFTDNMNYLDRLDRRSAKLEGVSREKLVAEGRSLPRLMQRALNTDHIVNSFVKQKRSSGQSLEDIIKRYGEGTDEGREFVQYLTNVRTLEVAKLDKKLMQKGRDLSDIKSNVDAYRAKNSNWQKDEATLKEYFDDILDYGVDTNLLSKKEVDLLKKKYKNYVPLQIAVPDETTRVRMQGGIKTNVSKQRLVQEATGADRPYDVSFKAMIDKTVDAFRQGTRQQFNDEILNRFNKGQIKGELVLDPAKTQALLDAQGRYKELVKEADKLKSAKRATTANKRVAAVKLQNTQKQALKTAKNELITALQIPTKKANKELASKRINIAKTEGRRRLQYKNLSDKQKIAIKKTKTFLKSKLDKDDTGAMAALDSMGPKDLLDVFKTMVYNSENGTFALNKQIRKSISQVEATDDILSKLKKEKEDLINTLPDKDAKLAVQNMNDDELMDVFRLLSEEDAGSYKKLAGSLAKKSEQYNSLVDDITSMRSQLEDNKLAKASLREDMGDLRQDSTVGFEDITGVTSEGLKWKLQTEPGLISQLKSLDPADQRQLVGQIGQMAANVQKAVFTGPLAPVFQAWQMVKNQGVMLFNAKGMSPYGARAIASFFKPDKELMSKMVQQGITPENYTKTVNQGVDQALSIASRGASNIKGKVEFWKQSPKLAAKDFFKRLNNFGAVLNNAQRRQIATGAYHNAKNRGFTDDEAVNIAAEAYDEVLGNINRASKLARNLEPIMLYAGATQQGQRAILKTIRNRPAEAALKATVMVSPVAAFVWSNTQSETGREYYKDMYENGQSYQIDNYITWVSPGARKNPDTNQWEGIWRTPIAPDFRPLNKAVNEQIYNTQTGEGIDPKTLGAAMFNQLTGGVLAETSKKESSINPTTVITNNPMVQAGSSLLGVDPKTGKTIEKEDTKYTSDLAKYLSSVSGINANRIDSIVKGQGGMAGRIATSDNENPIQGIVDSFVAPAIGPYAKNTAINNRIDDLVSKKVEVARKSTELKDKGNEQDIFKLRKDYNKSVDEFEQYIIENSKIRKLTDSQRKYINSLRYKTLQ